MKHRRFGRAFALACAVIVGIPAVVGIAATVIDYNNLPTAASLGPSDGVAIVQGGVVKKWLPYNYFLDHTASNAADIPETLKNLLANRSGRVFPADAYGSCTWDATSDVGPCINAAIVAAYNGGDVLGEVSVPAGNYGLATGITIPTAMRLVGAGGRGSPCGTTLTALSGLTGGKMIASSDTLGIEIERICLDGDGFAATGIEWLSVQKSRLNSFSITGTTSYGLNLDISAADAAGVAENKFADGEIAVAGTAIGLRIGDGTALRDVHHNYFSNIKSISQNGEPFYGGGADSNTFFRMWFAATGTGIPVFKAGPDAGTLEGFFRRNVFVGLTATQGLLVETGNQPSVANRIIGYKRGGAEPYPTVQSGAQLICEDTEGNWCPGSSPLLGDLINPTAKASTSTLTKTSDVILANVPGISIPLLAGKTYNCRGTMAGTAAAAGGIRLRLNSEDTLTATSARFRAMMYDGTTLVANTAVTNITSDVMSNAAAYTNIEVDGSIVVNAAGHLRAQMAQNTSNATPTTIVQGSHLDCVRIN